MANITVTVIDTAADADALSGTDLERVPGPGLLQIFAASTVNTAVATVVLGDLNIVRSQAIVLRANGVPDSNEDPPLVATPVDGGEKVVVNLGGTTGTIYTIAVWTPEEDL